jgi:hypothetical protein
VVSEPVDRLRMGASPVVETRGELIAIDRGEAAWSLTLPPLSLWRPPLLPGGGAIAPIVSPPFGTAR